MLWQLADSSRWLVFPLWLQIVGGTGLSSAPVCQGSYLHRYLHNIVVQLTWPDLQTSHIWNIKLIMVVNILRMPVFSMLHSSYALLVDQISWFRIFLWIMPRWKYLLPEENSPWCASLLWSLFLSILFTLWDSIHHMIPSSPQTWHLVKKCNIKRESKLIFFGYHLLLSVVDSSPVFEFLFIVGFRFILQLVCVQNFILIGAC